MEPRTNHHMRDSEEERDGIGLNCLSVNPKRARMGSLLVLDCTLYILQYMRVVRGCQNRFLQRTLTKVEESGGVYASLGTRQEGGRFEDVGLSVCASPLRILVLGFRREEFQQLAVGLKVSGGVRETEETEEFVGSIQCNI